MDVSKGLRPNGRNVLAVRVHNRALNGGIREPVHLVFSDRPLGRNELLRAVQIRGKATGP